MLVVQMPGWAVVYHDVRKTDAYRHQAIYICALLEE
jgi:hypothetical protein